MVDKIFEVVDYKALADHYIIRNGFVFLPLTYPYDVYDALLIRQPENALCFSPRRPYSTRSLDEHIALVNNLKLEKAVIIANSIDFIKKCPSLRYLKVIPADDSENGFDYSPLYDMAKIKSLECRTVYGREEDLFTTIDYSKISGLEDFGVYNARYLNYARVTTAKSLFLSHYQKADLQEAFTSTELDTLRLIQCKVRSLEGIQQSKKMQCLYLDYNKTLTDISVLKKTAKTLRLLRIDHCPRIEDFSVLGELDNLELLELSGNNELHDLNFLQSLKKLKTFIFSMNVKSGDLSPCMELSYVRCLKNRKHYNFRDDDLPKGKYVRGNESIEIWRRLE